MCGGGFWKLDERSTMQKCLTREYSQRPEIEGLLSHPYVTGVHNNTCALNAEPLNRRGSFVSF